MNTTIHNSTRPSPLRKSVCFTLFAALLFGFVTTRTAHATDTLWSYKPADDIKWYTLLDTGALLVGSENEISYLDPETGKPAWTRKEMKKINADDIEEIPGTPILLVADSTGTFVKGTRLYAIDVLTGKDIWVSDKLKGSPVAVMPNYEKGMVLLVTVATKMSTQDKPDLTALDLGSGKVLWQSEFTDKVDLYGIERGSKYFPRYNLSGTQPPVFDGDSVYFTYAGLHRFNLADGKLVWKVPYDITEGKIKQGNAAATIDGNTIYTSAKGQVRAIDKATGEIKWKSKDFGGAIAEMISHKEVLYGRLAARFTISANASTSPRNRSAWWR